MFLLMCEGKLAKYYVVLVNHLSWYGTWGFQPAALSHRGHVSPVFPGHRRYTEKTYGIFIRAGI
jgi:hypothetical protein